MAPTLEEVAYELARDARAEQRDVVASLRSRAAPLLAGAGALAALLAGPAVGAGVSFTATPAHAVLVCLGIVGAGIALLGAIVVRKKRGKAIRWSVCGSSSRRDMQRADGSRVPRETQRK